MELMILQNDMFFVIHGEGNMRGGYVSRMQLNAHPSDRIVLRFGSQGASVKEVLESLPVGRIDCSAVTSRALTPIIQAGAYLALVRSNDLERVNGLLIRPDKNWYLVAKNAPEAVQGLADAVAVGEY